MSPASQSLTPAQPALLPVDKHDLPAITHLANLPISRIRPLIPALLTWLQDENWPIFGSVRDLLHQYPKALVEPVRDILKGEDSEWIYNCLAHLVADMPKECQTQLKAEIERVAKNPTVQEKELKSEEVAQEIMKDLDLVAGGEGPMGGDSK